MTPRHSLLLTCATTLALFAGCRTSYSPPPQTSGGGYSAAAQQSADIDKMMEKGSVDLWVSPTTYFRQQAFYGVYRGPRPGDYSAAIPSSRGSFSKISRRSELDTAMVTLFAITPDGEDEIFKQTPYQIVELEILTGKPTDPPAAKVPTPPAPEEAREATTTPESTPEAAHHPHPPVHVHVDVHTTPQPQPQPIDPDAPAFVPASNGGRVAQRMGYWEVSQLQRDLVLACVVLRERTKNADGEPTWKYHGEVWIRDLESGEVFKHQDANLEPSSWQLHPGPTPQVEVVMADKDGWTRRIDLIDLNTLSVRELTARDKSNIKPTQPSQSK